MTTCEEREPLITAYADGELDAVGATETEAHLAACETCALRLQEIRAVQSAAKQSALKFQPPEDFEQKIRAAVRREAAGQKQPSVRPTVRARRAVPAWTRAALAAAALVVFAAVFHFQPLRPAAEGPETRVASEVVASHIRSLMAAHLFDVASTDRHTVKPWFAGRLDYSPPVADFQAQGYPLAGGRLDYLDDKPVAALVYRHGKHVINLFTWPVSKDEPGDAPVRVASQRGYNLTYWKSAGTEYWAVSDMNSAELMQFASLVQSANRPPPA